MVKIISLSKGKDRNVSTIEATFLKDGNLVPLLVNQNDRPQVYLEIEKLLNQEGISLADLAQDLLGLMSPEEKVKEKINSSYFLSGSLTIRGGKIFFGENRLEEALANHMLSLLDGNTPKDEKVWRSYVKFLDNMFQNASEDIRNQLFRWMEYENKAGNGFGITEDGCIVGYKGCQGTILEPMSKFTGHAIVDGVEYNGHIPNKVGSVVQMPRSAVTADPAVGCSQGLHVGTRDYAVRWAPVLLLVKVNPRDVVSVPYECESQKMRVCEYTVLKVTDASEDHKMYHGETSYSDTSDGVLTESEAFDLLGEEIYVETEDGEEIGGTVTDVYGDGLVSIIIEDGDEHYDIPLDEITYFRIVGDEDEEDEDDFEPAEDTDFKLNLDEAYDLLEAEEEIFVLYENGEKEFVGTVIDVCDEIGKDPGVVLRNDDTFEYKHIKLYRIDDWEPTSSQEGESLSEILAVEEEDFCSDCEKCEDLGPFAELFEIPLGTNVIVVYRDDETSKIKALQGELVHLCKCELEITILEDGEEKTIVATDLVSIQTVAQ